MCGVHESVPTDRESQFHQITKRTGSVANWEKEASCEQRKETVSQARAGNTYGDVACLRFWEYTNSMIELSHSASIFLITGNSQIHHSFPLIE